MAQSIYARTASRGFPVFDIAGQTGAGHLQDVTRLPEHAGLPQPGQPYPVNDPANTPAQLAPPEEYILGLSLWGLPGAPALDTTPHGVEYVERQIGDTGPGVQGVDGIPVPVADDPYPVGPYHDAPLIDPGLATFDPIQGRESSQALAHLEADATRRGDIDNSEEILYPNYPDVDYVGFQGVMRQDHVGPIEANGESTQETDAKGSLRGNMGFDAVQGYGGGGKGPGGTNLPELTTETRDYPGTFYAADNFVNVGEVPHIDAETAQFIQNQPGQAPWTGDMWSYPLVQTHAQDVTPADVPLQGPSVSDNLTVAPLWGL
jgi:hypothetical protein